MEISPDELESVLKEWQIRYSLVWEDFRCLRSVFPFSTEQPYLLIGSAGCNAFNCLLAGVFVDAVDLNPAQLALIELKQAGVASLQHSEFTRLLGIGEVRDPALYDKLRMQLSPRVRRFFDHEQHLFRNLLGCGRLEQFFVHFREQHLRPVCPDLCRPEWWRQLNLEDQRRWINSLDWLPLRQRIESYFDFSGLTRGRSAAQMKYVTKPDVAAGFFRRFRSRLESERVAENFYLHFFLTGQACGEAHWPDYLRSENYPVLRANLHRLRLISSSLEDFLPSASQYEGVILSDVFEYMSEAQTDAVFRLLHRNLTPSGRVAFWNLLVERRAPPPYQFLEEASRAGASADRMWFYDNFQAYQRGGP